jgi:toxin ParE1/3/4
MAVSILYSKISERDLRDIFEYIKKGSVRYAKLEVTYVKRFIKKLKYDAYLGKQFEKSDSEAVREVVFKNYRIIYEIISENKILILTIHHHARSLGGNPAFGTEEE